MLVMKFRRAFWKLGEFSSPYLLRKYSYLRKKTLRAERTHDERTTGIAIHALNS